MERGELRLVHESARLARRLPEVRGTRSAHRPTIQGQAHRPVVVIAPDAPLISRTLDADTAHYKGLLSVPWGGAIKY